MASVSQAMSQGLPCRAKRRRGIVPRSQCGANHRRVAIPLFYLAFALLFFAPLAHAQTHAAEHWVGTWAASPQMPTDGSGLDPADTGFGNQTLRMIARVSIGGNEIRVRFSNRYGAAPLEIGEAHVALAGKGAAILRGTDRALTFSGEKSFIIPPGAMVLSDAVHLRVPTLGRVAVSIFVPNATGPATWHQLARQHTYISPVGNFAGAAQMPVAKTVESWYWLSGIEALAPQSTSAVVALGDSITDGAYATVDANDRWPDFLANQISTRAHAPIAILNEGISGNRLLHDVDGQSALARFDQDVLAQDGVKYLIVLEGINDIGWPHMQGGKYAADTVTAAQITGALRQIAERAHAHGMRVFCGTLTPFEGAFYATSDGETEREAVNRWIRASRACDAVIDFAKATRDPENPKRFLPAYDSGDHLHPGDAGYKAMARAAAEVISRPRLPIDLPSGPRRIF